METEQRVEQDKAAYESEEAKRERESAAMTRRLIREFGDPNREEYRDPYSSEVVMAPGAEYQLSVRM